jgi:hypothetical protein
MIRTLRRPGRRALAPALVIVLIASASAQAADSSFEPQSTLAPRVATQGLSIDATIASMVRRGLLADIKPTAMPPAAALPAAPQAPPPARTTEPQGGWRPSGRRNTESAAPVTPAPLGWRQGGQSPVSGAPAVPFPDLPPTDPIEDTTPAPVAEASEPEAPALADEGDAAVPLHVAARPTSEPAEPPTSDDPLPDDHLAPIDELPETPAPLEDAPGDSREPEAGDEGLEGALVPPVATPDQNTAPPPDSLNSRSLVPVGEPDRIEQPDETAVPPSNTESYQEPDDEPAPRPVRPLSRNQIALRDKVRRVLKYYYNAPLNTGDRSPWEVMHCMLAYEVHSRILVGGPQGKPITAVGWLCFNQPCKGRTLMYLNQDGDMRVKVGPALQGHHGQLLALLAQARVRSDYPMKVEGKDFTVADLIATEKLTCYPKTELTFKLIGLQRYLDINATWMNDQGMQWDFPTLLREEMRQPVRTAACGGTHRLSGLMLTVKKRERSGLPVDGDYAAAKKFVQNYANYAYRLQNGDGSFSTEWFKGPGAEADIDRRLKTTGHQLEFLIYAAAENDMTNYRMVRAVNYLSNIMWANRGRDLEAGPLGHAVHALVLYDRLVFAPHDGQATPPATAPVAQQPRQQTTRRARR